MDSITLGKGWPAKTCARILRPLALALTALGFAPGCVTLNTLVSGGECPPTGVPCQVVATWHKYIVWTPDPVNGGVPTPGLAGRLYLFGPEIGRPIVSDGSLVVDLYDHTAGGQPVLLEEWRIDSDTLRRLLRRDPIGWGYTLFLPWGTYNPAITRVELKVRYHPVNGIAPLYAQSSPWTFEQEENTGPALARHGPAAPSANAAAARRGNSGPIMKTTATGPARTAPANP
jgi:hypothetical protein